MLRSTISCVLLALAGLSAQADPGRSIADFSKGTDGWEGVQPTDPQEGWGTWIDEAAGLGGAGLHTRIPESWMAHWVNNTNPAVVGDYTKAGGFTIGLDIRAESIFYLALQVEVQRNVVVELRDYDNLSGGYPYTSVWYNLGTIGAGIDWQHLSVTVSNPLSTTLPAGWRGYGAEDADVNPILPPGTTFADVLKGVDEIRITTLQPDTAFGYAYFDVSVDNISVTAVPEPATLLMQVAGIVVLAGALRRRGVGAKAAAA